MELITFSKSLKYYILSILTTLVLNFSLISQSGEMLHFDGSQYVTKTGFTLGSNWTAEVWARPTSTAGTIWKSIIGQNFWNSTQGFAIIIVSGEVRVESPSGLSIGTAINANAWTHLALTYNNGICTFYKDGIIVGTQSAVINLASTPFNIGCRTGNAGVGQFDYFFGNLDEIRIWGTTRTGCEIQAYMNAEISTSAAGLIANYHFNQGTAGGNNLAVTTLTDATGNGYTCTLNGFGLTGGTTNWLAPGAIPIGYTTVTIPTAEVNVTGNSNTILDGAGGTNALNSTNFGDAQKKLFTIQNTGTQILTVGRPYLTGTDASDFSITIIPSSTINSGGSTIFEVTRTTTTTGTKNATINFISNDCSEPIYDFAIQSAITNGATLDFDGVNDQVSITHNAALNHGMVFSYEAWVKPTGSGNRTIYSKGPSNGDVNNGDYIFQISPTNQIGFHLTFTNGWKFSTGTVLNNVWTHVAVTSDGTNLKFYINGVLSGISSLITTAFTPGSTTAYIGRQGTTCNCNFFSGDIDEVRVWSTTRTQCEIQSFMNCEIPTTATGLQLNYHFNQGVYNGINTLVTTLTESSNSRNGTLSNFGLLLGGTTSNWTAPGGVTSNFTLSSPPNVEINITGNGNSIVDGDITPSATDFTDFNGATTRTFVVQNTGSEPLYIETPFLSGANASDFTVTSSPTIIVGGGSSNIIVSFTSTIGGTRTATLNIPNNDCSEPNYKFTLQANLPLADALSFDGINDKVVTNLNLDSDVYPSTTWEAWIYPTSNDGSFRQIMSIDDGGWDRFVGMTSGNFYLGNGTTAYIPTTINLNQWQHIAVVFTGNIIRFYKNGVEYSTTSNFANGMTTTNFVIGGHPIYTEPFAGRIDEVRVWNYARSQCEILTQMNAEIPTSASGLIANYHFNQGAAALTNTNTTILNDAAGSNPGTLLSFALTGTISNWVSPGAITQGFTTTSAPTSSISVSGNGNNIIDGSVLTTTLNNTDFVTAISRTFVITNSGTGTLFVATPYFTGTGASQFSISTAPTSSLAASASSSFVVAFTPTTSVPQTVTLNIGSSDCGKPVFDFVIQALAPSASALHFDGVNDYVITSTSSSMSMTTAGTAEGWFKTTSTSTGFLFRLENGLNNGFEARLDPSGKLIFSAFLGSWYNFVGTSGPSYNDGNWHHFAIVIDGINGYAYIDGILRGTLTGVANLNTGNQRLEIGRHIGAIDYFNGTLDEIRVWNTARSHCQIQTFMNAEITSTASGLVANYHFNQGAAGLSNSTSTLLTDAAGSNAGTLTNFALTTGTTSNWVSPGGVANGFTTTSAPTASISLSGNGNSITDGSTSTSTLNNTSFIAAGSRTFVISNSGTGILNIGTPYFTGAGTSFFSLTTQPSVTLAAAASTSFVVAFNPTTTGTRSITINIGSNDCGKPLFDFVIQGVPASGETIRFDGANDLVSRPVLSSSTNSITIQAWVKLTATSAGNHIIFHNGLTGSSGYGLFLSSNSAAVNILLGGVYGGSTGYSLPLNQWSHLSLVIDNGRISFYANGILIQSFISSVAVPSGSFSIGGESGSSGFLGYIDEVRFWSKPLSQCEIQTYMNCEIPTSFTNLTANYHFNEGVANLTNTLVTLADYSGNGNNATLSNFALTGTLSNWVDGGAVVSGYTTTSAPTTSISLGGNGNSITDGSTSTSTLNNTSFTAAGSKTFVITNTGTGTLNIGTPYFIGTGASFFSLTTLPANTLAASATTSFVIAFTPTAAGAQSVTVNITNNDCGKPLFDFVIQGSVPSGEALQFDGLNDLVTTPNINLNNQSFSIEFWAKRNSSVSGSYLIGQNNSNTINQSLHIGFRNNNAFTFAFWGNDLNYTVTPTFDNNWHHWACVYNSTLTGNDRFIYMDGQLVASDNSSSNFLAPSSPILIGSGNGFPYTGFADEVRIWNTARTQCEIQTFMNAEITSTASGLVANYHFNQGIAGGTNTSVTSLVDATGTNNGTLFGFALTGTTSNWVSPGGVISGFTTSALPLAEINITGNAISIADGDASPSVTDFTDFGSSSSRTFVIQNTGTNPLNIYTPYITGPNASEFSVSVLASTLSAVASASNYFVVIFTPTTTGLRTATINVLNSDCNESPYRFAIQGASSGEALHFDGIDDQVALPAMNFTSTGITLEGWFYSDGVQANSIAGLIFHRGCGSCGTTSGLHTSGGIISYHWNDLFYGGGATYPVNTWFHAALVVEPTKATIYINGVPSYVNAVPHAAQTFTGTTLLGRDSEICCGSRRFKGRMDEIRLWNKALTSCEIESSMNAEIPTTASGLVANYHFNQGAASLANSTVTTLIDASGNGKNGTLANFALTGTTSNWVSPGGVTTGATTTMAPTAAIAVSGDGNAITDGATSTSTLNNTSYTAAGSKTFVITNTGTGTLNVLTPYFIGAGASLFSVTTLPATTLAASATTSFVIAFTPTAAGTQSTIVNITNNDCTKPVFDFVIQGTPAAASALNFDGVNDYVVTNLDADVDVMPNTTWELWTYLTSTLTNNVLIGIGNGGFDRALFVSGNQLVYNTGTSSISVTFTANQWAHVALVYNTANATALLYVNGILKSSANTSYSIGVGTTTNKLFIGAFPNGTGSYDGIIDEVRIWNTERTQCQIQTFMNAEITSTASGLVANYHFNQGASGLSNSTTTLLTDAAASNTGTLTNFALTGTTSNWVSPGGVTNSFTTANAPTPTLTVFGNGSPIAFGSNPNIANHTDFQTNTSRVLNLSNPIGAYTLYINQIYFTGANATSFSVTAMPASSLLANTASTLSIAFTPTALGTQSAVVNIISNDCANPNFSFVISASSSTASALRFDGVNDRVNSININPAALPIMTFEGWVYRTGGSGNQTIIGNEDGGWDRALLIDNSGIVHIWAGRDIVTTFTSALNTWEHYAVTWSTSEVKCVKNGTQEYITTGETVSSSALNAGIGALQAAWLFPFQGLIDEVRIWNTTRSMCQIQTYMNAEITSTASGLIVNYHFNQGIPSGANSTQTLLTDAASANNGTLTNFALTGTTSNWVSPGSVTNGYTTTSAPTATISLTGNGNSVPSGASTSTTNFTDFSTNTSRTFSITNAGTGTLYINSITFSGANSAQFSLSTSASTAITTGTTGFVIAHTPSTAGSASAIVSIQTNDCVNPTYSFVITASTSPASALRLDGSNDYVSIPHNASLKPSTFITIEAWVYPTVTNGFYEIYRKEDSNDRHLFSFQSSDILSFGLNVGGIYTELDVPITPTNYINQWVHLAAVYDGSFKKIYRNGELIGTEARTGTIGTSGSNPAIIGSLGGSSEFFNGSIDELRIWNTARTQCELQTYMNAEITTTASGLVANYHFNQGIPSANNSGVTTLNDATGTNNGTLMNFALTGTTSNWVAPGGVANGFTTTTISNAIIGFKGDGNPIVHGTASTSTLNHTNFDGNATRTFVITNTGTTPLVIGTPYFTGTAASRFSVTTLPSNTIAPVGTTSFVVLFSPTISGVQNATMNVSSNDCTTSTFQFAIQADGSASALSFDGVNDNITLPNNASPWNIGNVFTIETWIKPNSLANQLLLYSGYGCIDCPAWALSIGPESTCAFSGGTAGRIVFMGTDKTSTNAVVQSTAAPTLSVWTHVAVTGDGSTLKMYVNGVLQSTAALTFTIPNSTYRNIGGDPSIIGGCNYRLMYNGSLDEIRFWNRPLCQSEITNYMNCQITTTASGLTANYHFNQGLAGTSNPSQNTLVDVSSNLITGSLNNFALNGTISNWIQPGSVSNTSTCSLPNAPEIALLGNSNNIPNTSAVASVTNNTEFGLVGLGSSSSQTFVITNTGTQTLSIGAINLSGANASQFSVTTLPSTNVAISASTQLVITFSPTSSGLKQTTVNIVNSDCDESPFTFVISGTGGTIGEALDFDGVNDQVLVPDNNALDPSNITIETWVKLNTASNYYGLVMKSNPGVWNGGWGLATSFNGKNFDFWPNTWGTTNMITSNTTITPNVWYHVAASYNSSTGFARMYINGKLDTTKYIGTSIANSAHNLGLGFDGSTYHFNGTLDEVRIWNVERDPCQIASFMNAEITSTASGLVANYHFNQGNAGISNPTVTTLVDASGNGHNGTLSNFALTGTTSNWVSPGGVTTGFTTTTIPIVTINLTGNGNPINNNAVATSTSNSTNFGTASTKTFIITNTGTQLMSVGVPIITGLNASQFSVTVIPSRTIAPSGTSSFVVAFTPTSSGTSSAVINITNNDCSKPNFNFQIEASTPIASALDFNGVNNFVNITHTSSLNAFPLTVEGWIKTSYFGFNAAGVVSKYLSNSFNGWLVYLSNGYLLAHYFSNGTNYVGFPVSTSVTIADNTWHHFAFVVDANGGQIFIDGVAASPKNIWTGTPAPPSTGQNVHLGAYDSYFPGQMDEIRIWNTARTSCEIQTYMNSEITSTASGLIANYHFNQGNPGGNNTTITSLTDAAGSNHGTLNTFNLIGSTSNWISPGGVANGFTTTTLPTSTIALSANGNNIPVGITTSTTNNTNFGSNSTRNFTITNIGTGTLDISHVTITGSFSSFYSISTLPSTTLAASATTSLTIDYNPTSAGTHTAILNIQSNDCTYPTYSFVITASTSLASALDFNGSGDHVTIPTNSNVPSGNSPYTIEAWIKPNVFGISGIIGWGNYGTTNEVNALRLGSTGELINYWWANDLAVSAPTLTNGNWHHVAATFDGTMRALYVDGLMAGNDFPTGHVVPNNANMAIGLTNFSEYFDGKIDEVRVWNVARTSCEIQTYMNAEIPSTATGLILNYHFNQGIPSGTNTAITTLTDAATGVTGTLTNFALTGATSNWVSPGGVANGYTNTSAPTATLNLTGNGNPILAGSNTPTLSNFTDFGSNTSRTFSIQNTGTSILHLNTVSFSGTHASAFSFSSSNSGTFTTGNGGTFAIIYTPTSVGSQSAIVNIISNDCNNPTYSFVITASTTAASALNFDGFDDYVETVDPNFGTGDFTIETWFKTNTSVDGHLLTTRTFESSSGGSWWTLHNGTNGHIDFELASSNSSYLVISTATGVIVPGNWYHVAATRNGSLISLYVNGILQNSAIEPVARNLTTGNNILRLGAWPDNSAGYFDGYMDETRVWNVARTQCQLQTYMNAEITSTASGLIYNYHFNEGVPGGSNSTQTLATNSAAANSATLINFALISANSNWVSPGAIANNYTVTTPPTSTLTIFGNGSPVAFGSSPTIANHTDFQTNTNRTFIVSNPSGASALFVNQIYFTGANANSFSVTTAPNSSLAANAASSLVIAFTNTAVGSYSAIVNIVSNDCTHPTYSFVISASPAVAEALSFDGVNDVVQTGIDADTDVMPNTTWEAWVYPTSTVSAYQIIMAIDDGGWDRFLTLNGNQIRVSTANPADATVTTFVPNQWYHLAVSYNQSANQAFVYVNGVQYGPYTTAFLAGGITAHNLKIGANINYQNFFGGKIDEVRIWNTIRTQCEIQTYMNAEITSTASGLVGNFHFNQGIPSGNNLAITTLTNATGAGNGTLITFALTGTNSNWVIPGAVVSGYTNTSQPTASINLTGNGNLIPTGVSTNTANNTDFGTNPSRTFSISNSGTGTLNIGSIFFTGTNASQFSVTVLPASSLTTNGSSFVITLTPTNLGVSTATVNILSNDCTYPTYSFVITASTSPASAFKFDGVNDFATVANNSTLNTLPFTVETWFKTSLNAAGAYGLVSKYASGLFNGWNLYYSSGFVNGYYFGDASNYIAWPISSTVSISDNNWHHAAMVVDVNGATIYIDGVRAGPTHAWVGTPLATSNTLNVNIANYSNNYHPVEIDEVRLWNTARTQCELQSYMNAEITSTASGLMANYHFNQGVPSGVNTTVTTLFDATGNNNGTITNAALSGTTSNWISPGGVVSNYTTILQPTSTLAITGNGNPIPVGITTSTNNFTDFASNTTRTFVVQNSGTGTLSVNSIQVIGTNASQFSVTSSPVGTLSTAATRSFVINYLATSAGTASAIVNIVSNDCTHPTFSFVITASTTPASALKFDGTNDYVIANHNAAFNFSTNVDFTYEAKVRCTTSQSSFAGIVGKANNSGPIQGAQMFFSSNKVAAEFGDGVSTFGTAQGLIGTSNLNNSVWRHVAMVVSRANNRITLYVDGVAEATLTHTFVSSANLNNTGSLKIGSDRVPFFYTNGEIDEVRVWNVVRTQCEIQTYMNAEITSTASGLIANYHFNQGIPSGNNLAVNTLTDAAGSNTGTLTNMALTGATSNWVSPGGVTNGFTTTSQPTATLNLTGNGNTVPTGVSTNTANNTDFDLVDAIVMAINFLIENVTPNIESCNK